MITEVSRHTRVASDTLLTQQANMEAVWSRAVQDAEGEQGRSAAAVRGNLLTETTTPHYHRLRPQPRHFRIWHWGGRHHRVYLSQAYWCEDLWIQHTPSALCLNSKHCTLPRLLLPVFPSSIFPQCRTGHHLKPDKSSSRCVPGSVELSKDLRQNFEHKKLRFKTSSSQKKFTEINI